MRDEWSDLFFLKKIEWSANDILRPCLLFLSLMINDEVMLLLFGRKKKKYSLSYGETLREDHVERWILRISNLMPFRFQEPTWTWEKSMIDIFLEPCDTSCSNDNGVTATVTTTEWNSLEWKWRSSIFFLTSPSRLYIWVLVLLCRNGSRDQKLLTETRWESW